MPACIHIAGQYHECSKAMKFVPLMCTLDILDRLWAKHSLFLVVQCLKGENHHVVRRGRLLSACKPAAGSSQMVLNLIVLGASTWHHTGMTRSETRQCTDHLHMGLQTGIQHQSRDLIEDGTEEGTDKEGRALRDNLEDDLVDEERHERCLRIMRVYE